MTVKEARKIVQEFDENSVITEDKEFMFIEAMDFLISEEKNPADMMWLGGYYYEKKHFDLALKYYEMAALMDYEPADECLGYIWYYGRTGEKDYEKAYKYFKKSMEKGNIVSSYKLADMYKNGYFVEKDEKKYAEIIESLYDDVKDEIDLFAPVPEILTRLARIRMAQNKNDEAINYLLYAKDFLAQRITYNAFFGNINIMMWLIDDLYSLVEFDKEDFDFYDLAYLMKSPCKVCFMVGEKECNIEVKEDEGNMAINFNGKWFRDRGEFFGNALNGNTKLTAIYEDCYGFEVVG